MLPKSQSKCGPKGAIGLHNMLFSTTICTKTLFIKHRITIKDALYTKYKVNNHRFISEPVFCEMHFWKLLVFQLFFSFILFFNKWKDLLHYYVCTLRLILQPRISQYPTKGNHTFYVLVRIRLWSSWKTWGQNNHKRK